MLSVGPLFTLHLFRPSSTNGQPGNLILFLLILRPQSRVTFPCRSHAATDSSTQASCMQLNSIKTSMARSKQAESGSSTLQTLKGNDFTQSAIDDCLPNFGKCIILIYVDDTINAGPTPDRVNHVISFVLSSLLMLRIRETSVTTWILS